MAPAKKQRLVFNMAPDALEGKTEAQRATTLLDEAICPSRFNWGRAEQVFLFAIDNVIFHDIEGMGVGQKSAVLFPK